MNLSRKTSKNVANEAGIIPPLPDSISKDVENANWWSEVRTVLIRQRDDLESSIPSENIAFSTATSAPYEYNYSHGIGKYPMVQVLNDDGLVVAATITHNSIHDFTVSYTSALTGTLIIR
tara:strand:+ start:515 stop:874 length:360 start_codon:yes stop_codon:yes gene_type:complete